VIQRRLNSRIPVDNPGDRDKPPSGTAVATRSEPAASSGPDARSSRCSSHCDTDHSFVGSQICRDRIEYINRGKT